MARNIKRNVLKTKEADLAGIERNESGRYYREQFEDPDEWLEQGDRWIEKASDGAATSTGWVSSLKDRFTGSSGQRETSDRKPEYEDRGSFEHASDEDRSRDYREGHSNRGTNTGLSLLIGLGGGLLATYLMTQAQIASQKFADSEPNRETDQGNSSQVDEQSTVKVAKKIAAAANTEIPEEQKQTAGNAVHYGFGTLMGGVYGALASATDDAPFGTGIMFGIGLWLAADEFVLPYLGLSKAPQQRDLKEHAYEASMHAIYGLCLDAVNQFRKRVA